HYPRAQRLGKDHQPLVNLLKVAQLRQVCLMYLKLHLGVRLHLLEHIHAAPAAISLEFVGAVGDMLQFLQDEARHDHLGIDDPRITNIGNPAVDNDASIQNQRSSTLDLLRKLNIGDDEAKFVLGLQQRGD